MDALDSYVLDVVLLAGAVDVAAVLVEVAGY